MAILRKRDGGAASSDASIRSEGNSVAKPLPLKQRTSSSTDRRDFTTNTWISLLELIKLREYFIPVNHFSIWRRHNAWAFEDGKDLRAYINKRYASNMVFMSLLLSTQFGVLFNSSTVAVQVRVGLREAHWDTVDFWAGLFIILSSLFTILSLISTFTFTAMISAIDENNAHCILRSSIGQYATELPGRLIVFSIYTFLIAFMSFFFILLPLGSFSICLLLLTIFFFVHVVTVFSSFGRLIMHTGAMGKDRIFSSEYEELLVPHSLHSNLLSKAKFNLANNTSIIRQYRHKQRQIDRFMLQDELHEHLSGRKRSVAIQSGISLYNNINNNGINRVRADSKVRFADEETGLVNANPAIQTKPTGGNTGEAEAWSSAATITTTHQHNRSTSGSSPNHFRTLTPMSDVSDASLHSSGVGVGGSLRTTPSPDRDTATPLAPLPKSFFGSKPERPADLSKRTIHIQRDTSAVSSINTISNESMEQWLQGSSSSIGGTKYFLGGGEASEEKKTEPSLVPTATAIPPQRISVATATPRSNSNTSSLTRATPSGASTNEKTITSSESSESAGTLRVLDSEESLQSQRAYDREMTEDERFLFDYGDFEHGSGSSANNNNNNVVDQEVGTQETNGGGGGGSSTVYGTTRKLYNADDRLVNNSASDLTEDERTRLL